VQRFSGHEEKAEALGAGGNGNFIAVGEHNQSGVAAFSRRTRGKASRTADHIGHGGIAWASRVGEGATGGQGNVEVFGVGADAGDRADGIADPAADDLDGGAGCHLNLGDFFWRDPSVAGRAHLFPGREIKPQLKAVHRPVCIALRHLLMDNAAARRHPLHVAAGDDAAVAQAVAVLDLAFQHIGDGLDAAVGMPGETLEVVGRGVGTKVVKKKEGVASLRVMKTEGPAQVHACPFPSGNAAAGACNRSCLCHDFSSSTLRVLGMRLVIVSGPGLPAPNRCRPQYGRR